MEYIVALIFVYFLYNGLEYYFFIQSLPKVEALPSPKSQQHMPKLSIVVAACNEEKNIKKALNTLIQLNYPALEIILVNDRSTDHTGEIINTIANQNSNVKTVHITSLPSGWMGKNHALFEGAKQASGDWLLFTDADVNFHPKTLSYTMQYINDNQLDHLAILPTVDKGTVWFNLMMLLVTSMYYLMAKPWRASKRWSKRSVGQGSFNLIRKTAYKAVGGHQSIRLNSDDDVKLGQLLKQHQFKQQLLLSDIFVTVPWYHSLPEMTKGLEKNIFAFLNYSVPFMLFFTLFTTTLFFLPLVGLWCFRGLTLLIDFSTVVVTIGALMLIAFQHKYPLWYAFTYPITLLIDFYISWRSVYLTLKNKGVTWRGTFYPLNDIKAHHVKTIF